MPENDRSKPTNVVIGAGPAGLAVMKELKDRGIPFLGIEREGTVGGLWNIRNPQSPAYAGLTTNSSKSTTYLDRKAPTSWPSYFSHELAHRYLCDFAERHHLCSNIRFNTSVVEAQKLESDAWEVTTVDQHSERQSVTARKLVICAGLHNKDNQYIPLELLEELNESGIDTIHSSQYKEPACYTNKRVLILGFGNSAADIATEISVVAKCTTLCTRTVPWIIPLWVMGVPADQFRQLANLMRIPFSAQKFVFHCLQRLYIGHPKKLGVGDVPCDLLDRLPVSDRGLMKAIRRKRILVRGPVDRVDGTRVYFKGQHKMFADVDAAVVATGYSRKYAFLNEKYLKPIQEEEHPFPLLVFHPEENDLFFTSEVNVPQGSWPLFIKQAKAIGTYLQAEDQPGENFTRFNSERSRINPDLKGKMFSHADRYHVDPDIYARHIDRFCEWIRS